MIGMEQWLAVDLEKAFDSLEWGFLYATLEKFGLGGGFLGWTRLLYADPTARVITGGVISDSYKVERGTRQGCPLSPLLFALAVEPLALAARKGDRYMGLGTATGIHCIALYADDMLLFLRHAEEELEGARALLTEFGRLSGL